MIKKFLLLSIILISASAIPAQSTNPSKSIKDAPISKQKITFYKVTNPDKTVKLKAGRRIWIEYVDSTHGISEITGKIYAEKDSVLYIYYVWDCWERPISVDTKSEKKYMYPPGFSYPHDSIIGINFKNITYVVPDAYGTVSAISFLTSIASGLIIGPLVSIDYSNRTFDSERYRAILYPSIGLLAASIIWTEFWNNHWGYYLTVTPLK